MARIEPDQTASRLVDLCTQYLRAPDGFATDGVTGAPILDFDEALSGPEQTIFDRLSLISSSATLITPDEYEAIEGDIGTVDAFLAIAEPTDEERIAAQKAEIRILAAMLRS